MTNESFLALACAGVIGLAFGIIMTFLGYRLFLILLPIFGFFFGFSLGAQTIQALFGDAFLATVTSWVVGFVVALVFAGLAYLFYLAAVLIIAFALGYTAIVGLMSGAGMVTNFLVWILAVVVGIALAFITYRFNLQKWVIEIGTAVLGAAACIGVFVLLFNPAAQALQSPVQRALQTSPLLAILFVILAIAGIYVQAVTNRTYNVVQYNRWETYTQPLPPA
ncbi:MAG: DUF4203 domain-containing protein [Anaerolineae bacterium]